MKNYLNNLKADGSMALVNRCLLASLVCPVFLVLVIAVLLEARQ